MRLLTIVGVNAIIGIGWLLFANWAMRCSQSHGWVSSFVEVSLALNIALSIRRVSEECIKPAKELVHRKINERIRSHEHKLSQEVFVKFKDSADVALTRFEDTELPKLTWCVRIAQITSFLALVMLLGCDDDSQWIVFVPALKLPPIWFFVTFHIMALQSFLVFVKELDSIRESESLGENADMTQLCRDMNFGRIRSDFRKEQKCSMVVLYKKLWKLLIDKGMKKQEQAFHYLAKHDADIVNLKDKVELFIRSNHPWDNCRESRIFIH